MKAEEEKRQWEICGYCGAEETPEAYVAYLMARGKTREQAEEHVFRGQYGTYRMCPNEHTNCVMVPLNELEHGAYYHGHCRNATIARWNAEKQYFVYMREKFRTVFPESIKYWVEGHHFDEFQPFGKLENPPFEIPLTD
jgi:hypothetical protein